MAAREVVVMFHAKSGQTQRASRRAFEDVWAKEGWKVLSTEEVAPPADVEKPLDKMKVDELKAYAEMHEIDLAGATAKGDILAAIVAHNEAQSPAGSNPGDPDGQGN